MIHSVDARFFSNKHLYTILPIIYNLLSSAILIRKRFTVFHVRYKQYGRLTKDGANEVDTDCYLHTFIRRAIYFIPVFDLNHVYSSLREMV